MVELYELLSTLNLPLSYHHFSKPQKPPFMVYFSPGAENFEADNKVYQKKNIFFVEVYSPVKDLKIEERIEKLFDENEIVYEKRETYISTESLYQVVYEILI